LIIRPKATGMPGKAAELAEGLHAAGDPVGKQGASPA
jgi:hypothetical protein